MNTLTLYIIPPILSLLVSLTLAGIAFQAKPRTTERKLLALICIWWGLLSPAFISHHLLVGIPQILAIERVIHFFYVFLPALNIVFVHHLLNIPNKRLVVAAFSLSALLAATTPTSAYIYGLYHYDWGYIAKGGPAFQLFGIYGMATLGYVVWQTIRRLKRENNRVRIRKHRYIIFSFCISGVLTLLNIPSMNGYDLYPAGNFLFVPLSVLGYGVLKYRLMDIRSILMQVALWCIISVLVLVPNVLFLLWLFRIAPHLGGSFFMVAVLVWFVVNHYTIRRLQPLINRRFSRNRRQLNHAVKEFIANAVFLKNLDLLVAEFLDLMRRCLNISRGAIFLDHESANAMIDPISEETLNLSDDVVTLLASRPCSASIDMLDTHPLYAAVARELGHVMNENNFRYMVPLVQAERLVGVVLLSSPNHGTDLSPDELKVLDQLSAVGIAFSNSAIYKRIADLKENLEKRTTALTIEVEERQRIEQALRESEEKHRIMAENIKDVLWKVDMDMTFTYVSPAVEKMQGWPAETFMQFSLEDFMPPESVEKATNAMMEKLLQGERTGDFSQHVILELEQYTKSGTIIQTEVNASFMLDNSGRPCGILGATRDISERIRAAREKEELQEQLARSKKMEALGMLAGGVAHDLNNILSGIMSYPEVIMMQLPPASPLIKPLQTMRRSGQRAAAVVNDLVTIARGVASARDVTSLNRMIGDHLNSPEHVGLLARYPQVRVDVRKDEALLNITCSRIHIEKVLMNLLANAVEAVDGKGVVTVATANCILSKPLAGYDEVVPGEYVRLRIVDTGPGIPADDLNRIFEPFYTKKMMGRSGTGLGLAIVWNTVVDHDGYIVLTSGATGTCFDLYLPGTASPVPSDEAKSSMDDCKGEGQTILVVDDDPTQREIASAMLASLNYRVATVESGEAAVDYIERHPVDLMILDMIMAPGMNGRETYQAVIQIRPGQRAIIASGFSANEDVTEAQRLGAGGLLKKPYAVEKLGRAVMRALAGGTDTRE